MTASSKEKHTPGPWTASETYPRGDWCIHSKGIPQQLAYVAASSVMEWPLEANARLIAAAPEMLKALQQAKRLTDNINEFGACTDGELYDAAWQSIESAIARATGDAK